MHLQEWSQTRGVDGTEMSTEPPLGERSAFISLEQSAPLHPTSSMPGIGGERLSRRLLHPSSGGSGQGSGAASCWDVGPQRDSDSPAGFLQEAQCRGGRS